MDFHRTLPQRSLDLCSNPLKLLGKNSVLIFWPQLGPLQSTSALAILASSLGVLNEIQDFEIPLSGLNQKKLFNNKEMGKHVPKFGLNALLKFIIEQIQILQDHLWKNDNSYVPQVLFCTPERHQLCPLFNLKECLKAISILVRCIETLTGMNFQSFCKFTGVLS